MILVTYIFTFSEKIGRVVIKTHLLHSFQLYTGSMNNNKIKVSAIVSGLRQITLFQTYSY